MSGETPKLMTNKLAQMRKTFRDAWRNSIDDPDDALDAGLTALLREHVQPMLIEAYGKGFTDAD